VFDDQNLVSCDGLIPVMTLAKQTGLLRLLADKVHIAEPRIKSGAANPAPKLATLIAGMSVGADCIDDIDVLRSGGMKTLFDGVYAPQLLEPCCGSSPSVTPVNSNRCCAIIWWRCVSGSTCSPAPLRIRCSSTTISAPGCLHLPSHWPWSKHCLALWHNTIGYSPPPPATP
jgi:hypothetical protein